MIHYGSSVIIQWHWFIYTIRKVFTTGIIDHNEKMYIWGEYSASKWHTYLNLSWKTGSLVPTPRSVYNATLLSDNNIIYIGK